MAEPEDCLIGVPAAFFWVKDVSTELFGCWNCPWSLWKPDCTELEPVPSLVEPWVWMFDSLLCGCWFTRAKWGVSTCYYYCYYGLCPSLLFGLLEFALYLLFDWDLKFDDAGLFPGYYYSYYYSMLYSTDVYWLPVLSLLAEALLSFDLGDFALFLMSFGAFITLGNEIGVSASLSINSSRTGSKDFLYCMSL